jgi:hypothetical protein
MAYKRERDLPKKLEQYHADPQKFRDRKKAAYVSRRTPEQKAKHAEYMRQYYAAHPGYKAEADKKHRRKYLEKLRQYDAYRNQSAERKAEKVESARLKRQQNPEKFKVYASEYYQNNKERYKAHFEKRRKRLKQDGTWQRRTREYTMRHKYRLSIEQYDAMFQEQNGLCAICGGPPRVGMNKKLHIDHDHATGKVRGLLCMHCNHSIERVEKCQGWAAKAEAYLARPR